MGWGQALDKDLRAISVVVSWAGISGDNLATDIPQSFLVLGQLPPRAGLGSLHTYLPINAKLALLSLGIIAPTTNSCRGLLTREAGRASQSQEQGKGHLTSGRICFFNRIKA